MHGDKRPRKRPLVCVTFAAGAEAEVVPRTVCGHAVGAPRLSASRRR